MPLENLGKVIDSREKAIAISDLAQEKKAEDIKILDVQKISGFCDYFVITAAGSFRQTAAIADHIADSLALCNIRPSHSQGRRDNHWIILDYSDVVVHVFYEETRRFYDLERLWGDAVDIAANALQ
jgi:ribosome-associated protein